jgi:exosortase D (VPLPA-CTERM-specific)
MSTEIAGESPTVLKETRWIWATLSILAALLFFTFYEGLRQLVSIWGSREEYSYGYLIPVVTLFLIWQKKPQLEKTPFTGSWLGLVVMMLGFGLLVLGNLSTLFIVVQYAFLVVLAGIALTLMGREAFKIIAAPLALLVFMIPLPQFFLQEISNQLQLVSSQIGVWVIRLFGISVFLEGNVIDLGAYKLQVVEACNGLRYLFPLMTLGFIITYFFHAAFWKRAIVFLSTIPITILMNSFRIGVIGVLVEYWGPSMAEGFLHDFEGWVIFMACTGVLVAEIWVLSRIGGDRRPLREVFGIELPEPTPADAQIERRSFPAPLGAAVVVVLLGAITAYTLPQRAELIPSRQDFAAFPTTVGSWHGKDGRIEQIYLDALKLDDYILADFEKAGGPPVNFYVAYYASQRKGQSAHSPRTCIPGGGWKIVSLAPYAVDGVTTMNGQALMVNRTVIQMGDYRQLLYYWFQQRGRNLTNEYLVKWYLFWDALTRNRTDGGLVRLTTLVRTDESLTDGDRRLMEFARIVSPQLKDYIPE